MEFMCAWVDDLVMEMNRFQNYERNLARQKNDQQRWLQKRREENKARQDNGEEQLPEEDPTNPLFKPVPEPRSVQLHRSTPPLVSSLVSSNCIKFLTLFLNSRLESLLISHQVGHYCTQINQFAGQSFTKLFLAGSMHKD